MLGLVLVVLPRHAMENWTTSMTYSVQPFQPGKTDNSSFAQIYGSLFKTCRCHHIDHLVIRHTGALRGRGVLTTRAIPKGTLWYQIDCGQHANPDWGDCLVLDKDLITRMKDIPALRGLLKNIWKYSWYSVTNKGYVLDFNVDRYVNHCTEPNSGTPTEGPLDGSVKPLSHIHDCEHD